MVYAGRQPTHPFDTLNLSNGKFQIELSKEWFYL